MSYSREAWREEIFQMVDNKPFPITKVIEKVARRTRFSYINAFTEVVSPMIQSHDLEVITMGEVRFVQLGNEDHTS